MFAIRKEVKTGSTPETLGELVRVFETFAEANKSELYVEGTYICKYVEPKIF